MAMYQGHTHTSATLRTTELSFTKILSGVNAFEINNLQEQETESRYPGDPDVTSYHERDQAPSSNVAHQIGLVSRHERFVPQC